MNLDLNDLERKYSSMAKLLLEVMSVNDISEQLRGCQLLAALAMGMVVVDCESKALNENQLYKLVIAQQQILLDCDESSAEIFVEFVFGEVNDKNPIYSPLKLVFNYGKKFQKHWEENDIETLRQGVNSAISEAEKEMFGQRVISIGEDFDFSTLKTPTVDQLPPPESELKHYDNFVKRFNPVPFFKDLWGDDYRKKASDLWELNATYFRENRKSTSSIEELILCVEYSYVVGPYIGDSKDPLDFFRWLIQSIRTQLKK